MDGEWKMKEMMETFFVDNVYDILYVNGGLGGIKGIRFNLSFSPVIRCPTISDY